MKARQKHGVAAAALGKLLEAAREVLAGSVPALRPDPIPIPIRVRRPGERTRRL